MPSTPHPCSLSVPTRNGPTLLLAPTLAAPETEAERTQRHLALCRALQDHGMQLMQEAAAHMRQSLGGDPETYKQQVLAFTRLSHAVRQAILLEQRIARGQTTPPTRPTGATRPASCSPANPAATATDAPRPERLADTFACLADAEIPAHLAFIGTELGVTLAAPPSLNPEPPAPEPPAPTPPANATPTPAAPIPAALALPHPVAPEPPPTADTS